LVRQGSNPVCIGQKQKWFLLQLVCKEEDVDLLQSGHPEFDDWRWVSFWYPVRNVVSFKRDVYRRVMKEFSATAMPEIVGHNPGNYQKSKRRRKA
jgi:putative (di)nucleoside polyphosphate hydrolase